MVKSQEAYSTFMTRNSSMCDLQSTLSKVNYEVHARAEFRIVFGKTKGQNSRETVPSELWICGPRITSQSPFGSARHLEEDGILSPTDSNITAGERNTEVILLYYC